MNEEVEIKVKIQNPQETESKILSIAKFIKQKQQIDQYTDAKNLFFGQNPISEYLRVRTEGNKSILGYHYCHFNPDGSLLKTDEYEIEVNDSQMAVTILEKIGFEIIVTVTKTRSVYETDDYEITLDHIKELGYFLELEYKGNSTDFNKTKEEMYKFLDNLEILYEQVPEGGFPDLIYKKIHPGK